MNMSTVVSTTQTQTKFHTVRRLTKRILVVDICAMGKQLIGSDARPIDGAPSTKAQSTIVGLLCGVFGVLWTTGKIIPYYLLECCGVGLLVATIHIPLVLVNQQVYLLTTGHI